MDDVTFERVSRLLALARVFVLSLAAVLAFVVLLTVVSSYLPETSLSPNPPTHSDG